VGELDCDGSILVNVTAVKVRGKGLVLYNVVDASPEGLDLEDGTVLCDVFLPTPAPGRLLRMRSGEDVCGGQSWAEKVRGNEMSFSEVYRMNRALDLKSAERFRVTKRAEALRAVDGVVTTLK
jgi:hypothetical protein